MKLSLHLFAILLFSSLNTYAYDYDYYPYNPTYTPAFDAEKILCDKCTPNSSRIKNLQSDFAHELALSRHYVEQKANYYRFEHEINSWLNHARNLCQNIDSCMDNLESIEKELAIKIGSTEKKFIRTFDSFEKNTTYGLSLILNQLNAQGTHESSRNECWSTSLKSIRSDLIKTMNRMANMSILMRSWFFYQDDLEPQPESEALNSISFNTTTNHFEIYSNKVRIDESCPKDAPRSIRISVDTNNTIPTSMIDFLNRSKELTIVCEQALAGEENHSRYIAESSTAVIVYNKREQFNENIYDLNVFSY